MPFPSNSNVVSSAGQLGANVVTTAKILDGAVTPAKIENGTQGYVLTAGASAPAWAAISAAPVGMVSPYAGSSAPTGWLLADGSVVSQSTYAALYAVIGHTYAADPGGGNFTLPNLKGKVAVGYNASETEFDVLGETGGAKTHTLQTTEIPSHTHGGVVVRGAGSSSMSETGNPAYAWSGSTGSAGGGGSHNNLQPYIALNYIIKI